MTSFRERGRLGAKTSPRCIHTPGLSNQRDEEGWGDMDQMTGGQMLVGRLTGRQIMETDEKKV